MDSDLTDGQLQVKWHNKSDNKGLEGGKSLLKFQKSLVQSALVLFTAKHFCVVWRG